MRPHNFSRSSESADRGTRSFTAYNIASAYTLMNQPEPAVKWLQTAADDGLPCYPLFAQDTNLDSLRKDEHFIAFMIIERRRCRMTG
jgi:hypothetical protein